MFIAVIVSGMEKTVTEDLVRAEDEHAADQAASDRLILEELRALRAEIAELRADRPTDRA
jgi:voltage-gated sodium channel